MKTKEVDIYANENFDYTKRLWWNRLSDREQNILIDLLYDLDLAEYVKIDDEGRYIDRIS